MLKFTKFMMTCSIAATLTMAASSAHAGPECSADFHSVMTNYAQMQRVHDYAVTTGVYKQSESVMALTCFDDLVARTSRAGDIFSDVLPDAAMATWGAVAYDVAGITNGIGLYHSTIGITNRLGYDLSFVVSEQLLNYLASNFTDNRLNSVVGGSYGSDWFNGVDTQVGSLGLAAYMDIYNRINTLTSGASYNCSSIHEFWDQIATRQGTDTSMSYLPYDLLVAGTTSGNTDYNDVIGQTDNATLISNAQSDYNEMVNATETFDFERTMPTSLTVDSSIADVVAAM